MKFKWTMEDLKASDNEILRALVTERKSGLNPYAPLAKRLSEIYSNLDKKIQIAKDKLNIRVLWGDGQHGISYESFKSQDELDGYLRAIDDHDGWLSGEVSYPDSNGNFESLDEETRKSLLASGYDEDDLKDVHDIGHI